MAVTTRMEGLPFQGADGSVGPPGPREALAWMFTGQFTARAVIFEEGLHDGSA
jgi:hypothetical protein